jgi:hypothetical protein
MMMMMMKKMMMMVSPHRNGKAGRTDIHGALGVSERKRDEAKRSGMKQNQAVSEGSDGVEG